MSYEDFSPAEIIKDLIKRSEVNQFDIGKELGLSEAAMSNRIRRDSFSAKLFLKIISLAGYTFEIKKDDKVVKPRKKGVGPRVRCMVNGKVYDTKKADAICHTDNDKPFYIELYVNSDDYLMVHYSNLEGTINTITPITKEDAMLLQEALA